MPSKEAGVQVWTPALAYDSAMQFLVAHAQEPRAADARAAPRAAFDTQKSSEQLFSATAMWIPNGAGPQTEAAAEPISRKRGAINDLGQTSRLLEPKQEAGSPFDIRQLSQPFQPASGTFGAGAPAEAKADTATPMRHSSGDGWSGHTHSSEVCMRKCRKRGTSCSGLTSERILVNDQLLTCP